MRRLLKKNPIASIAVIALVLYSIGVPVPWLGRNPCTSWFKVAVYVMIPTEVCYTMTPAGWQKVALP